jgi:hypothetical protein
MVLLETTQGCHQHHRLLLLQQHQVLLHPL